MKARRWLAAVLGLSAASGKLAALEEKPKFEHAVVVHFSYGSTDLKPLFALEERLESAIAQAAVGEYDGNEVATDGSDGYLYMYGPDADALLQAVKPILEGASFMRGAKARLRYRPPQTGAKERIVVINP
jgi:hypothetical protein